MTSTSAPPATPQTTAAPSTTRERGAECPTDEQDAWFAKLESLISSLGDAFADVGEVMSRVGSEVSVDDPTWQDQVERALSRLESIADEILAVEAVAGTEEMASELLFVGGFAKAAAENLRLGIASTDRGSLEQALWQASAAGDSVDYIARLMQDFCR